MKERLTDQDYAKAAIRLNTGIAEVKAVTEVESNGKGFTIDGLCVIRFEPHLFSRFTKRVFDLSHPKLSYEKLNISYPRNVNHSWELFNQAVKLDANAAVKSTSWGLFQICGFNATACGCNTLTEFVERMERSELDQLILFCNFIINTGLDDELRSHNWPEFKRIYNGPSPATNFYVPKLIKAFEKHLNKKA